MVGQVATYLERLSRNIGVLQAIDSCANYCAIRNMAFGHALLGLQYSTGVFEGKAISHFMIDMKCLTIVAIVYQSAHGQQLRPHNTVLHGHLSLLGD
jgi:hypothetical protein